MTKRSRYLAAVLAGLSSFTLPRCANYNFLAVPSTFTCADFSPQAGWQLVGFSNSDLAEVDTTARTAVARLSIGERRRLAITPGLGTSNPDGSYPPILDCTSAFASTAWTSTDPMVATVSPDAPISSGANLEAVGSGDTTLYVDIAFRGKSGIARAFPFALPRGSGPVKIVTISVRQN